MTNEALRLEIYRKGNRALYSDIYRSNATPPEGCLLFIHGGALLTGSRKDMPREVIHFINSLGWDVACGEYRLVPSASIEEIISDVMSCVESIRKRYPAVPLILSGYSAGAYLALLAGAFKAPVDALISFAGYGDLLAEWCITKSSFFIEYKNVDCCATWLQEGHPFSTVEQRIDLYVYLRQMGTWSNYVVGAQHFEERARQLSPIHSVDKVFPRTFLIHGTVDCDVPVEASECMAEALASKGARYELFKLSGFGHDLYTQVDQLIIRELWGKILGSFSDKGFG